MRGRSGRGTGRPGIAQIAALSLGVAAVIGPCGALSSRAVAQPRTTDVAAPALERALTRAERDLARGRLSMGIAGLWRAARRAPLDARAPLRLAALLLPGTLGQEPDDGIREAAAAVRAALETAADAPGIEPSMQQQLRLRAAFAQAVAGDPAGAVTSIATRCGRLDAASGDALRVLAAAAVQHDRLADAEGVLDHALRCAGPRDALLADRGAVRLARGRTVEAVDDFREVVRRRPGDVDALRDLAGALLAGGRTSEALTLHGGLAARAPDDARAHLDLARAALEARDLPRAIEAARTALRLDVRDAEPALLLAAAHLAAGARGAAIEAFREALRRRPDEPRAVEGLRALAPDARPDAASAMPDAAR